MTASYRPCGWGWGWLVVWQVRLYRFVAGLEGRLEPFLVLLRARLGWGFRALLSLRSVSERSGSGSGGSGSGATLFRPGLAGWPVQYGGGGGLWTRYANTADIHVCVCITTSY